jgi:hypothetical protein
MIRPLDLSRARLRRAAEQLACLSDAVAAITAAPLAVAELLRDAEPARPIEVCLMAGEIVYNLRAALDHLVWGLATHDGRTIDPPIGFPLCDTPEQFKHLIQNGMLKGVPRKYYPLIASAQPYLTSDPGNAPLKLLKTMAIADAQHALRIVVHRPAAAEIGDGRTAVVFQRIGSYENAPVLPVLGFVRSCVAGVVDSFEKCY